MKGGYFVYPLSLTVEHEEIYDLGEGMTTHYAVVKLNGWCQVARIPMEYYHQADDREALEQAVGDWLAKR